MEKLQAKYDEVLDLLVEKTGQDRKIIQYGVWGLLVVVLFFGFGGNLISRVVGVCYPAFESLKALETARGQDDKKWLTYWVVFALFNFSEHFLEWIVGLVPFYFVIKMAFLLWLYLPLTNGADLIYDKFVYKYFKKYEDEIDEAIDKVKDKVVDSD
jgi:receptor expression-enhancing protein 5/6